LLGNNSEEGVRFNVLLVFVDLVLLLTVNTATNQDCEMFAC